MLELAASYKYIVAIALAWCSAHLIKHFIAVSKGKSKSLRDNMFKSGGMPSSHSAIVSSVAILAGLDQGFDSTIFGVVLALALIVAYDAAHVRQMAGATAESVNRLIKKDTNGANRLLVHRGHTTLEVAAGALLGVAVAIVVFFATQYS